MTTSDRMRHCLVSFPKGSTSLQGMEEQEEDDEPRSPSNTPSKSYRLTEDDISFRELSTAKTRVTSTDAAALAALAALVDPRVDVTHVLNNAESSSAELQSTTV